MIEIVPAIDIIGGKCVRLSKGDYQTKKVYSENPLEVAKMFANEGITRLHLVDLDGAKEKHIVNWRVLENIASNTPLIIDFGGGLKSDEDLRIAFDSGAKMVTGGSIAVKNPETFLSWLKNYGSERIILGADANEGKIAVSGWEEKSELDILDFISAFIQKGVTKVISTDIACDGMLQGPSFSLYREIMSKHKNLYLVASGGISCVDDILKLDEQGIPAVIVGKAIYENRISLKEIGSLIN